MLWVVQNWGRMIPRWPTTAYWKYINRCIPAISGTIFTKFCVQIDIYHTIAIYTQNPISRRRWPPSWIWIFGCISVINEDICFKFGALIDIDHTMATVTQNPTFAKTEDGLHKLHNLPCRDFVGSSLEACLTTGVYRGSEHSIEQRFLMILAFGLVSLVTQHCTSRDKPHAALS